MNDRDRLIELIADIQNDFEKWCVECAEDGHKDHQPLGEYLADKLLQNGAIVPPCKVGDMVYYIINNNIQEVKVSEIKIYGNNYVAANAKCLDECEMCDCACDCSKKTCSVWVDYKSLGKTVFLTKEEAEEKLKELQSE